MNWKTSAILSIIPILALCAASGEAAIIRGFVVDSTSAEPLPMANVLVKGTERGAATNSDGYFVIDHLDQGRYVLQITYLGYRASAVEVEASDGAANPLRISVLPEALALKEIVVSATAEQEQENKRLSPRVSTVPLTSQTLRAMPSLGAEMDVLRAIQTIPGVKASSDLSSALYVRGGSPDQTLILMDHNVVYNPSHMFGLFSTFNADAVKRLELLKGGFPAEYGGRSGSVLDVITNEGNRNRHEGLVSLGIISARAALEGPLPQKRGSYAVSGRRTYMEPILESLRNSMDTDLPDYYFYDANGKINLDLSERTTLTLAGYLGQDKMTFEFGAEDERGLAKLKWGNQTFTGRLRHVLSRNLYASFGAAVSQYLSRWGFEDDGINIEEAEDHLVDYSVKADLEYLGHEKHRLKTGFWVSRYDFRFLDRSEDLTWVDIDTFTYNYSLYLQDVWKPSLLFEVQPGLRAYYHQAGNHFRMDPRLAFLFHVDENKRIKLAGGRYTQWINLVTFGEGFSNFDLWVPVDASMKPAYSDQIVFGFEWDPRENMEMTTEAYYTEMNRIVTFDPLTDEGQVAADPFVSGDGYAYGGEWMIRKNQGRVTGWMGYSLSWTQRRFPHSLINNGSWYYPKWDRRHDFIIVANFEANRRWDLSASWRYNTGQGYTQGLGIYTQHFAGISPEYWVNNGRTVLPGSVNNYRFPADHRMDLTATYKHYLFGLPARLNLSIYNVYSRRSYWMRSFDTRENPVEITNLRLLPILPLISYEVRF